MLALQQLVGMEMLLINQLEPHSFTSSYDYQ